MIAKPRTLLVLPLLGFSLLVLRAARADDQPTLELSMDEAVKRALESNADIAVEKYNPEFAGETVRGAEGYYDPFLSSTLRKTNSTSPASNAFSGGTKVDTNTFVYNFGLSQAAPTGATLSATFNNARQDTTSVFSTFNPSYQSTFTLGLAQPLLRGFRSDYGRQALRIARKNKEISDVQFHQTVVNTIAGVKQAYYDLIYAIDNLSAARKSLALAQKLLDENQIRVKVGTMAPLDVVEAQAEVASREQGVIVAESAVGDAEDAIKRAIFPKNDPGNWALKIVPTDRPSAEPVAVDADAAIKVALEKRTDVVAARKSLERSDISLQYARSQFLPQVDLVASYGATGIGGDQLVRDGFGGPVINTIPGGYGDAVSSVFGRDFPTWSVGVNLSYPIRNRQAGAARAQAVIARDQAEASLNRLELQVAAEVRSAARAVETGRKSVDATRAARVLAQQRLDAEEKKFAAGMSTNFLVTQAQRDLAVAEVSELQAIANYRKSLINFDRVQEAGLSSSGSVLALSSATTTAASTSAARTTAATSGTSQ